MSKTTPTKERDVTRIALGKAIAEQLKALNISCEHARAAGLGIDFRVEGYTNQTPEIKNMYIVSRGGNVKNIWEDVFQCVMPKL